MKIRVNPNSLILVEPRGDKAIEIDAALPDPNLIQRRCVLVRRECVFRVDDSAFEVLECTPAEKSEMERRQFKAKFKNL